MNRVFHLLGSLNHTELAMIEAIVGNLSPTRALLWAVGLFTAYCVFRKLQASAQIARQGARAPKVKFYLPYGRLCLDALQSSWGEKPGKTGSKSSNMRCGQDVLTRR